MMKQRLVIVGTGETGAKLQRELADCGVDSTVVSSAADELFQLQNQGGSRFVIAEADAKENTQLTSTLLDFKLRGLPVESAEESYERLRHKLWLEQLKPESLIYSNGFTCSRVYPLCKRAFDITFSIALLALSAPLLAVLIVAIWIESGAPALIRQTRMGHRGKSFILYKLRSMRQNAEEATGPVWSSEGDPRVTRLGRFLRKFRLDEIPQALNVLRGDMSFVGPRPERPHFVSLLSQQVPYYDLRHHVKPGITGWAQVMYPYGASIMDACEKLQYDLYYAKHMSILLDLEIMLRSAKVVLCGRGR